MNRTSDRRTAGLGRMLSVLWRTQWKGTVGWVGALALSMIGTAAGVAGLYNTPAKIHTYAQAVTSGSALVAINGKVEGIDSLGGVIQDEFGFLAAFLLPLLGISLMARATRREEEAGRLETLLAGRIARPAPALAALVMAGGAIVATVLIFAVGLVASGVPFGAALLYSLSLGALAFVFAGFAALLAQLTLHSRGVYTWGLIVLALSYVVRGIGDVTHSWLTWLSPLGWAEKAAPFGPQRWWALALPLVIGLLLAWVSMRLAVRRDLGSALLRGGAGPARAGGRLRSPVGFAVWLHRGGVVGWLAGGVILTAMMGTMANQMVDAMRGNPALSEAMGLTGGSLLDGVIAVTQLYLAVIVAGYVVAAVGALRAEESGGRLETRLAGTLSRTRWLAAEVAVILGGMVLIAVVSSLTLALTTAWSTGSTSDVWRDTAAGLAYLPSELVLAGLAVTLFGIRPRLQPLGWAAFAAVAFIAFLGTGLKLPGWVLDLAPTTHVGNPPLGSVETGALVVLSALAVLLIGAGFLGFRRRGIPQT